MHRLCITYSTVVHVPLLCPFLPFLLQVVALDASAIVHDARRIVSANGLSDRVTVLQGKAEEIDVAREVRAALAMTTAAAAAPSAMALSGGATSTVGGGDGLVDANLQHHTTAASDGLVDVIVSEWMGYALLYECMLDSVLTLRDSVLRPGGLMLPSHAVIRAAAVSSSALWSERVASWSSVYGFDMSSLATRVFDEPFVEVLPSEWLCSSSVCLRDLDLLHMVRSEQDILCAPFEFVVGTEDEYDDDGGGAAAAAAPGTAAPPVHGVAVWFDIRFTNDAYDPAKARARAAAATVSSGGSVGPTAASAATSAALAPATTCVGGVADGDDDDVPPLEDDTGAVVHATAVDRSSDSSRATPVATSNTAPAAAFSVTPAAAVGVSDARCPTSSADGAESKPEVFFSTGPNATPTHWQQTLLLLREPIMGLRIGESLKGTITMSRDPHNPREYRFLLDVTHPPTARRSQAFHMR